MKRFLLAQILLLSVCYAGWTPLATVPASGKNVFLGQLALLDASNMPEAATEVSLRYDDQALYIIFHCDEPMMDKITQNCRERDGRVWADDCIEVFLQPEGWKDYAHLVVNAVGTQYDELCRDSRWNLEWSAAVTKEATGWVGILTVPFAKLGGTPKDGSQWRINICRQRNSKKELSTWSPTSGFHDQDCFGTICFADAPALSELSWSFPRAKKAVPKLNWEPVANALQYTINGQALDASGEYAITQAGSVPLRLEARLNGKPLLRTQYVVTLSPIDTLTGEAKTLLENVKLPEAEALLKKIQIMENLSQMASVEAFPLLEEQARGLLLQANRLKIRSDFLANGGQAGQLVYGVDTSLTKHLRHRPFRGQVGGGIRLDAARNEMDATQILLFTEADSVLKVTVQPGACKGPNGAELPASTLRLRRVGYIQTIQPVYKVDHVGQWPDPLMQLTPFDIQPDSFETLWLDVRVPVGTAPGVYKGQITVKALNRQATAIPLEIRVRNFTIPQKASIITAFGLGPGSSQDRDAYLTNFLEHRITPYTCVAQPKMITPPCWDWQQAEALEIQVQANRNCRLNVSASSPEKGTVSLPSREISSGARQKIVYAASELPLSHISTCSFSLTCEQATLTASLLKKDGSRTVIIPESTRQPSFSGEWLAAWPTWSAEAWDKPDVQGVFDWAAFDEAFQKALDRGITSHIAQLRDPLGLWSAEYQRHLSAKGWLQYFYTYLYDEPEPDKYPYVNERLSQVKLAGNGGLWNMMTARSFPPELPYVDVWCPELYSFNPELCKAEQAKGRNVWWYVAFSTRHPYPDVWIDYPAVDCRIWPWMTWKYDIDGMLYWSATAWSRNNPWRTGETYPHSNGDGSLMYPGDDGKPVDSIRWECLRDGMEDFEVFCLLEAAARELGEREPELRRQIAALCAIDKTVMASYKDYNTAPQPLLKARAAMSDCLEQAVAALGHEPVITGRPRRRPGVSRQEAEAAFAKSQPKSTAAATERKIAMPPATAHPQDGLVLAYDFDGTLPYVHDVSGYGRLGMPTADCRRTPGHRGEAMTTAANAYVMLPSGEELLGQNAIQGSVEFWVRPDFNPEELVGDDDGHKHKYACLFYLMESDGNGLPDGHDEIAVYLVDQRLAARCGGFNCGMGSIPSPLRKGQWTHIALTWKEGERVLYVNGKPVLQKTGAYPPSRLDAFRGTLGAHAPSKRFPFRGSFDDFRIWTRALTLEEIARSMEK